MVTGQFFGGVASGFQNQEERNTADRALAIKQQQYDIQNQTDATATIDQQVSKTLQIAAQTAQIAQDNGKPPDLIARAIQPIIDSAASLAQRAPNGQDYVKRVQAVGNAILLRSGVQQQSSPVTDTTTAPTAVQPTAPIAPTDTFSPGEIARANPPLSGGTPFSAPTAPITPPVAPLAQAEQTPNFNDRFGNLPPATSSPGAESAAIPAGAKPIESTANLKASDIPIKNPKVQSLIDSGQTSQEDLDYRAQLWLLNQKSTVGLGRGKEGAAFVNAIQARGSEIARARGLDPGELNAMTARTAALSRSLAEITRTSNAIEAFERTAEKNGDKLVELAKEIDQTGIPVIERVSRPGRLALGDPKVAAFMTQYELYKPEVAKILTQSNMSGVLTDTQIREIQKAIQPGASYRQLVEVHELLKADFGRRNKSNQEQIDKIMGQFQQKSAPSQTPALAQSPDERQRLKELYGLK